jgi:hypothetical protein
MKATHTPGPWVANPKEQYYNGSKNTFEVNFGSDGECVTEVVHGIENAKLIAAAPDLLEMLGDFVRCYKRDGYITNADLEDAEELINKAINQ